MGNIGLWDLDKHQSIADKILTFFDNTPEVYLKQAVVFGSYGSGTANKQSSDIDILLGVSTTGILSETEQKQFYENVSRDLVSETDLTEDLPINPAIDIQIVEHTDINEYLRQYAQYSGNYQYYDLLQQKKQKI